MGLSLRQEVAQTIVVRASGHLLDTQAGYPQWEWSRDRLKPLIEDMGVGGVLLFGGTVADVMVRIQQMQDWATVPLLVCADVEAGVGQRFRGATRFPPAMALDRTGDRAIHWARQMGRITANEATAIGINWLLAPVVDVQSNPQNPVIDVRAFGTQAERVAALTSAFIAGAQASPVLTTAKHFPGHGDTGVDSHIALATIPHDRDRLEAVEWLPFQRAIAAGVSAIMSAHITVPALDEKWPATLSTRILDGILRQQWHFSGLIVTDAMTMGALHHLPGIAQPVSAGELAVRAIEAGSDIVLMPADPEAAIEALYQAVRQGRISRERIRQSVTRILRAKQKVCDPRRMAWANVGSYSEPAPEMVPVAAPAVGSMSPLSLKDALPDRSAGLERLLPDDDNHTDPTMVVCQHVGLPESWSCAEAIAREAIGIERGGTLPLRTEPGWLNWIWVDSLLDAEYLSSRSPAIAAAAAHQLPTLNTDLQTPHSLLSAALNESSGIVAHVFVQAGPFRGFGGLHPTAQHLLVERLAQIKALVCYGSRGCFDQLVELSHDAGFPCIHAADRWDAAQAEVARLLWGQPIDRPTLIPEA